MTSSSNRPGFALMLVLVFIVLFLGLLGIALRQTAAALRIETIRTLQIQRDEGSVHAVARGIALLESGLPPSNPYVCTVEILTSRGVRPFTVTFASEVEGNWTVNSVPAVDGEAYDPMPVMFP